MNDRQFLKKTGLFKIFLLISFLITACYNNSNPESKFNLEALKNTSFYVNKKLFIQLNEDSLSLYNPNDTSINPFYKTTYSSQVKGDTICIDIPGVPIKIINMNNSLILISYKTIKYLPNNIDEVLQLDDNFHILNKSGVKGRFKKDLFIVPEHFEGICAIAYQQPDGILPDIDSSGNNVFIFDPDCMLLSVKTTEDIYNIACNNIQFYYRDSHGKLREIKVIRSYSTDNPVDYSAINLGLNQFGRGILNQIVGDSISGNILFFYIGNSQHDLSHPDSLLFNGKYYMLEYSN